MLSSSNLLSQGYIDHGDGTVTTPNGLRLDDGTIVDIMILYDNTALGYWGTHSQVYEKKNKNRLLHHFICNWIGFLLIVIGWL